MKKVLYVASEAVPFIKTGGLADVVGSIPKCFPKEYFDVRVVNMKGSNSILSIMKNISAGTSHIMVCREIWKNSHFFPKRHCRFFR